MSAYAPKADDLAEFWAGMALRLLAENAALKAKLDDQRLAAHAIKDAQSDLERLLAASTLMEMALKPPEEAP